MKKWRRRPATLVCRDAIALVTDYLEGVLPQTDKRRLEAHLARCPHCAEYVAQLQRTITLAGQVDPEALNPRTRLAFTALYRDWRAADG